MKITITKVSDGYVVRVYNDFGLRALIERTLPTRLAVEMFLKNLEW